MPDKCLSGSAFIFRPDKSQKYHSYCPVGNPSRNSASAATHCMQLTPWVCSLYSYTVPAVVPQTEIMNMIAARHAAIIDNTMNAMIYNDHEQ